MATSRSRQPNSSQRLMGRTSYRWSPFNQKPSGSKLSVADISGSRSTTAWFRPDMPGLYTLNLAVKGHGHTYVDPIRIKVIDLDKASVENETQIDDDCFVIGCRFGKNQPPVHSKKRKDSSTGGSKSGNSYAKETKRKKKQENSIHQDSLGLKETEIQSKGMPISKQQATFMAKSHNADYDDHDDVDSGGDDDEAIGGGGGYEDDDDDDLDGMESGDDDDDVGHNSGNMGGGDDGDDSKRNNEHDEEDDDDDDDADQGEDQDGSDDDEGNEDAELEDDADDDASDGAAIEQRGDIVDDEDLDVGDHPDSDDNVDIDDDVEEDDDDVGHHLTPVAGMAVLGNDQEDTLTGDGHDMGPTATTHDIIPGEDFDNDHEDGADEDDIAGSENDDQDDDDDIDPGDEDGDE